MDKAAPVSAAPHRRFFATFDRAARRLRGSRLPGAPAIWTAAMTSLVIGAMVVVGVASFFDEWAIRAANSSDLMVLRVMSAITDIGQSQWYLIPTAVLVLVASFANWAGFGLRTKATMLFLFGQAAYAFAAVALSGILVNILKILFGRARPALLDKVGPHHFEPFTTGYLNASFPSGHSTTVGAVTAILAIWFPRFTVPILLIGVFVGITRIAANAHYPSDVAAGLSLGFIFSLWLARWFGARGAVFRLREKKLFPVPARRLGSKTLAV